MRKKSPIPCSVINIPSIYFTAFCFGSSGFANLSTLIEAASVHFGWILITFFLIKDLSILNGGNTNKLRVYNAPIAEYKQFSYIYVQTIIYVYSKQGQSILLKLLRICPYRTAAMQTKKATDNTINSKENLSAQTIQITSQSHYSAAAQILYLFFNRRADLLEKYK